MSNDHRVTIFNVDRNKVLLTISGGKEKIHDIAWSKRKGDLRFVTVSPKHLYFWYPADVTKKLQVKATFGQGKMKTMYNT